MNEVLMLQNAEAWKATLSRSSIVFSNDHCIVDCCGSRMTVGVGGWICGGLGHVYNETSVILVAMPDDHFRDCFRTRLESINEHN